MADACSRIAHSHGALSTEWQKRETVETMVPLVASVACGEESDSCGEPIVYVKPGPPSFIGKVVRHH